MFVFKKYDRQNHVWSFMTKYLRFLGKFTIWSGETPTGIFNDVFLPWRIMSVLIGWPIWNPLTPHDLARLLRSIVYKYRILLFFKYNYVLKRKTAINVFLVHIWKENTGFLTLKRNHLTRKPTRKPLPPLEFDEYYSHHFLDTIM
jgi:hypothetical protein